MRFLLLRGKGGAVRAARVAPPAVANPAAGGGKTWGQQCSPQCGCVLRFEATLDENARVTSCQYHAKSVLVSHNKSNGQLEPQHVWKESANNGRRRLRRRRRDEQQQQRPLLLQECQCTTLHELALQVTRHVQDKSLGQIRNQMEFTGPRSSVAFSHAVLQTNGLPTNHTHCVDLVEESLTAMTKGHMPAPRRRGRGGAYTDLLSHRFHQPQQQQQQQPLVPKPPQHQLPTDDNEEEEESYLVERYGRALRRFRKILNNNNNSYEPRATSALNMYDLAYDGPEVQLLQQLALEDESKNAAPKSDSDPTVPTDIGDDWEHYVDELYCRDEQSA